MEEKLCSPDWKVSRWHQYLIFSKIIHLLVQMSSREEIKHAGRASKRPGVDRQAVGRNINYRQGFWLQDMQVELKHQGGEDNVETKTM